MISLSKNEARLYNYMMEVINQVMDNYGYDFIMGKMQIKSIILII